MLNIISQGTNYLNYEGSSYFGVIMQVNITTMTVLAIIYRSVSTSLPATTTIKMVEIWLLSSLIYPFLIIVINICIHKVEIQKQKQTMPARSARSSISIRSARSTRVVFGLQKRSIRPANIERLNSPSPNRNVEQEPESEYRGVAESVFCLKYNTKLQNLKLFSRYILPFLYVIYMVTYFCIGKGLQTIWSQLCDRERLVIVYNNCCAKGPYYITL